MQIRRATPCDIPALNRLLLQVLMVHHRDRPDLFRANSKKYSDDELHALISDDSRPIFVCVENEHVLGYAFCVLTQYVNDNILTDIKTLYIDDLCVDETVRGRHIGTFLYEHVVDFARKIGCYNVTLNVWAKNESAIKFYESCGLTPQKIGMEIIL